MKPYNNRLVDSYIGDVRERVSLPLFILLNIISSIMWIFDVMTNIALFLRSRLVSFLGFYKILKRINYFKYFRCIPGFMIEKLIHSDIPESHKKRLNEMLEDRFVIHLTKIVVIVITFYVTFPIGLWILVSLLVCTALLL